MQTPTSSPISEIVRDTGRETSEESGTRTERYWNVRQSPTSSKRQGLPFPDQSLWKATESRTDLPQGKKKNAYLHNTFHRISEAHRSLFTKPKVKKLPLFLGLPGAIAVSTVTLSGTRTWNPSTLGALLDASLCARSKCVEKSKHSTLGAFLTGVKIHYWKYSWTLHFYFPLLTPYSDYPHLILPQNQSLCCWSAPTLGDSKENYEPTLPPPNTHNTFQ